MRIGILIICFALVSCYPKPGGKNCDEMVNVPDYQSLDGCEYLLETEAGKKMLPLNGGEFRLGDYSRVAISVEEVPDQVSTCMSEDMIVRITCFSEQHSIPRKPPCLKYDGPPESGWLPQVMQSSSPSQIVRYDYLDGFAYLYKKADSTLVYDCQGNLLCTVTAEDECLDYLKAMSGEVIIWNAHR